MSLKSKPLAIAGTVTVIAAVGIGSMAVVNAKPAEKISICHATSNDKNPYVTNSVDPSSFYNSGHDGHTGPIFDPTADPPLTSWGDIIPPIPEADPPYAGLNWPAGQATLENGCTFVAPAPTPPPTPTPTPTPTATETPTGEPSVPVEPAAPVSDPVQPPPSDDVPVVIADPGATPSDVAPGDEQADIDVASPPSAPVPSSVPAGGGASRQR